MLRWPNLREARARAVVLSICGYALCFAAYAVLFRDLLAAQTPAAFSHLLLIAAAAGQIVGTVGLMRLLGLGAQPARNGQPARWPSVLAGLALSFSLPGAVIGLPPLALGLLYAATGSAALGRILNQFYEWLSPGVGAGWLGLGLAQSAGLLVTVLWFVVKPGLISLRGAGGTAHRLRSTATGIGAGIVLWMIGNFLQRLTAASPLSLLGKGWIPVAPTSMNELALGVLIAGLIGPLAEELFFRGFALRAWQSSMGSLRAAVATAALFAAAHLSPADFPALFLVGLGLGWLTLKTNRLWPAIVAHGTINVTSLCLLYFLRL
mgnify:FL=1